MHEKANPKKRYVPQNFFFYCFRKLFFCYFEINENFSACNWTTKSRVGRSTNNESYTKESETKHGNREKRSTAFDWLLRLGGLGQLAEDIHIESRVSKAIDHINLIQKDEKTIKQSLLNEDIAVKAVQHNIE